MSEKIGIDAGGLRVLRDHAIRAGTLDKWADIALEWADMAEKEIERLKDKTTFTPPAVPPHV